MPIQFYFAVRWYNEQWGAMSKQQAASSKNDLLFFHLSLELKGKELLENMRREQMM